MTLPMNLRSTMSPAARRIRACFAPVVRSDDGATNTPAPFDFGRHGRFALASPPLPWLDLGWIENFSRAADTRVAPVRVGPKAAPAAQFRSSLGARVEFDFRQWGKLQMALSSGSQHMNVLAPDLVADPSGQTPFAAVAVQPDSTATQLLFEAGATSAFAAGDLIAVDVDYSGATGYIGSGIAAAYVSSPAQVHSEASYVRRVTFNVARVASVAEQSITLAQPLAGGDPLLGAKAQKIAGFCDRESGSFFQEWSALFVIEEELGGRILFHYPRLQCAAPAREAAVAIAAPLEAFVLRAAFTALPVIDPADSEQVLCYRAYFPAASAAVAY
jgi:hypothetical protein